MRKEYFKVFFTVLFVVVTVMNIRGQSSGKFTVIPCETERDVINVIDTVLLTGLSEKGLVRNIRFKKGDPSMVGRFYGGEEMSFSRGVILTTGLASNAVGPNSSGSMGRAMKLEGDKDLSKLAGDMVSKDAVVIEFDFTPISNVAKFEYFFASEEYNNYVGAAYNDVFGFFVSGEGIDGPFFRKAVNIALIPETGDYVGINSVNCGHEKNYKLPPSGPGQNCDYLIWNNHFPSTPDCEKYCQYNSYTKPIVAQAELVACKEYHIKLAISDIQDFSYDSGVFLKAASFDVGGLRIEKEASNPDIGPNLVKNCNEVTLKFTTNGELTKAVSFPLVYGGDAVLGQDVPFLPNVLEIPAGEQTSSVTIAALNGTFEGKRELYVVYPRNVCLMSDLQKDTLTVYPNRTVSAVDLPKHIGIECDDEINLSADPVDGFEPYNIEWSQNGNVFTTNDFQFVPTSAGKIRLNVSDACGSVYKDSTNVKIGGLTLDCGPDLNVCPGVDILVEAETNGSVLYWNDGSMENFVMPKINRDTLVWCKGKNNCGMWLVDTVRFTTIKAKADAGIDQLICPSDDAELKANDAEAWLWSTGETTQSITVQPQEDTEFTVEITDKCGNNDKDAVLIDVKDDEFAFAGNDTLVCKNSEVTLNAKGGARVQWLLNDMVFSESRKVPMIIEKDITFVLKTFDYCENSDQVTYKVDPLPDYSFDYEPVKGCPPVQVDASNTSSNYDQFNWTWKNMNDNLGTGQSVSYLLSEEGKHDLKVMAKSHYGCVDSIRLRDIAWVYPVPKEKILPKKTNYTMGDKLYDFFPSNPQLSNSYVWALNGEEISDQERIQLSFPHEDEWLITLNTTNKYSCVARDTLKIISVDNSTQLLLPNAFSPNDDGVNDLYKVVHRSISNFHCHIYNRWGELLFSTKDVDFEWDGRDASGKVVSEGAYVIGVEFTDLDGEKHSSRGMINVIR